MRQVNIHEAKTHLSRLIEDAEAGEEIIIARSGKPVARLTGMATARPHRQLGLLKGKIEMPDDVYNGLLGMLMKNVPAGTSTTVQIIAFTPKPQSDPSGT